MSRTIPVQVTVDTDELREWAAKHANAGHHGVAHVLYLAVAGVESVTEQHDRELREQIAREITDLRRPLHYSQEREDAAYARAARIARGEQP